VVGSSGLLGERREPESVEERGNMVLYRGHSNTQVIINCGTYSIPSPTLQFKCRIKHPDQSAALMSILAEFPRYGTRKNSKLFKKRFEIKLDFD
jgi:hypothetical protein